MRKRQFTDFDVCIGWGIYGPLSQWLIHGFYGPTMAGITILGFLIEIKFQSVVKDNE